MSAVATLFIMRGASGQEQYWSRYDIAYEPGQSVLDGLRRIHIETDQSLAFRYSCINANACKECLMLIDGRVAYACATRLEARQMRLEPLPKKPLIRDLVTEIAPPDECMAMSGEVRRR